MCQWHTHTHTHTLSHIHSHTHTHNNYFQECLLEEFDKASMERKSLFKTCWVWISKYSPTEKIARPLKQGGYRVYPHGVQCSKQEKCRLPKRAACLCWWGSFPSLQGRLLFVCLFAFVLHQRPHLAKVNQLT